MNMDFFILALATWRITSLLVEEEGPYMIFVKLRHYLGVTYNEHSERVATTEIGKAFNCVWCLSVWVGITIAVIYIITNIYIFLPLALSAMVILIHQWMDSIDI